MTVRTTALLIVAAWAAPLSAQVKYIPPPPVTGTMPERRMPEPITLPETGTTTTSPPHKPGALDPARASELIDWFNLLKVRVDRLDDRVRALEEENARLRQSALRLPDGCAATGVVNGASLGLGNTGANEMMFPTLQCRTD